MTVSRGAPVKEIWILFCSLEKYILVGEEHTVLLHFNIY
jgi:hypothetical protein